MVSAGENVSIRPIDVLIKSCRPTTLEDGYALWPHHAVRDYLSLIVSKF